MAKQLLDKTEFSFAPEEVGNAPRCDLWIRETVWNGGYYHPKARLSAAKVVPHA